MPEIYRQIDGVLKAQKFLGADLKSTLVVSIPSKPQRRPTIISGNIWCMNGFTLTKGLEEKFIKISITTKDVLKVQQLTSN